ncbi:MULTISPECIES: ABC transporter substrate-binding protein [Microbacterium]|uniref:ABC transporter substrate-binding protein n=1 Tax=Microbacterium TaxID=33882 RepID=UPI0012FD7236|nr:ABC transporter substrate-binding protein [Microbacterium lacus]
MRTKGVYATLLIVAAAGLAACSSAVPTTVTAPTESGSAFNLEALTEAAQAEGSLTLYADSTESVLRGWSDGFTKEYGIPVTILRNTAAPLYQQFAQEQSAGQAIADVFGVVDAATMADARENGWIAQYTPQNSDLLSKDLGDPGYYWALQSSTQQTVTYNPDNVTEDEVELILKDPVKAMTDPRFAGRVGVVQPQVSQGVGAFWYLYSDGAAAANVGWDGLEDIADNTAMIADNLTLVQNVIQGEIDFAFPIVDSIPAAQIVQNGAPLQFAYATPATGSSALTGIVADAPHPNAARLFLEWAAEPDANSLWSKLSQTAPINAEATDGREFTDLDWYQPAGDDTWFDFGTDPEFLAAISADGDYFDRWNEMFGYTG